MLQEDVAGVMADSKMDWKHRVLDVERCVFERITAIISTFLEIWARERVVPNKVLNLLGKFAELRELFERLVRLRMRCACWLLVFERGLGLRQLIDYSGPLDIG